MADNILGNIYGKWLVIDKVFNSKHKKWYYKCQCQCNKKTIQILNKNDLVKGKSSKCNHCSSNTFIYHTNYIEGLTKKGESFFFDIEDLDIANKCTWSINRGYVVARKGGQSFRFHREIMKKHFGEISSKDYIDHIDKDKSNNRKSNLRICNSSINQENRKNQINNKTGYKGVHLCNKHKKYRVAICKNYKTYHIGYFDDLSDAIKARDLAERRFHSESYFIINKVMPEIEFEEVDFLTGENRGGFGTTGVK